MRDHRPLCRERMQPDHGIRRPKSFPSSSRRVSSPLEILEASASDSLVPSLPFKALLSPILNREGGCRPLQRFAC